MIKAKFHRAGFLEPVDPLDTDESLVRAVCGARVQQKDWLQHARNCAACCSFHTPVRNKSTEEACAYFNRLRALQTAQRTVVVPSK